MANSYIKVDINDRNEITEVSLVDKAGNNTVHIELANLVKEKIEQALTTNFPDQYKP